MRTIHGVGEMMTQMVLSRGSLFPASVPDVQPIVHPSKQASPAEHEDVTVMDTKLKIIEILQVRPSWPVSRTDVMLLTLTSLKLTLFPVTVWVLSSVDRAFFVF